jgi:hypothetical protein
LESKKTDNNSKPLPLVVRRVLAAARRRYHRLGRTERPSLLDPVTYCGLFTLPDLHVLARTGHWPLPARAIAWLAEAPRARRHRRRCRAERIADVVREVLVDELPAAVRVLARRAAP